MEEIMKSKETSYWWWFDSHDSYISRRSPWLQSTLAELETKTKAMLKLIEEDADSFAERAEMYYEKRPEIINMVEDFYRAFRSLAEQYDLIRSDCGHRLLTTFDSPFSAKRVPATSTSVVHQNYDGQLESCDPEDFADSEVDDPPQEDEFEDTEEVQVVESEQKEEIQLDEQMQIVEIPSVVDNDELIVLLEKTEQLEEDNRVQIQVDEQMQVVEIPSVVDNDELIMLRKEIERLKEENRVRIQIDEEIQEVEIPNAVDNEELIVLREEIERLKEENQLQKEQLSQKDDEKKEVIRQLSLAVELHRIENLNLRKVFARNASKKQNCFEFRMLKEAFLGR